MRRTLYRIRAAFWLHYLSRKTVREAWATSDEITRVYFDGRTSPRWAVEDYLLFAWY